MPPVEVLRRWSLVPAVIAGLALVAFASRSSSARGQSELPNLDLLTLVEVWDYVALGVGLVLLPWVVLERARRRLRPDPEPPPQRASSGLPTWATVLAIVAVCALALVQAAAIATYVRTLLGDPDTAGQAGSDDPGGEAPSPLGTTRDTTALLIALVILIGLAILAVGAVLVWRRMDAAERHPDDQPSRDALRDTVELGLDALRLEPDPRLAVIAAYAAMERSMSRVGLARSRSEAPVEYLRRIVAAAPIADDAAAISDLFQIAKFSPQTVDEPMRQRAIAALEGVRSTLAASPANAGSAGHRQVAVP